MAKLTKKQRQAKKREQLERKKIEKQVLSKGYKKKEVEELSRADLQKLTQYNIPQKASGSVSQALQEITALEKKERRRAQQREASRRYRKKKADERPRKRDVMSEVLGLHHGDFIYPTDKWLDKHSIEDIRKLKRTGLREFIPKEKLSPIEAFDFNKVYKLPAGKKLHFAFRALNGEKDIGSELADFDRKSNEELISFLKTIKEMPLTGTKGQSGRVGKRTGSSGQAGEAIIRMNSQPALSEIYASQYNDDRRGNNFAKLLSKTAKQKGASFQHSGIDYHWQAVRQVDEHGRLKAYTEITPRKLLVIGNALMWNMTEADRGGFYNEFYSVCCDIIPEMKNILP